MEGDARWLLNGWMREWSDAWMAMIKKVQESCDKSKSMTPPNLSSFMLYYNLWLLSSRHLEAILYCSMLEINLELKKKNEGEFEGDTVSQQWREHGENKPNAKSLRLPPKRRWKLLFFLKTWHLSLWKCAWATFGLPPNKRDLSCDFTSVKRSRIQTKRTSVCGHNDAGLWRPAGNAGAQQSHHRDHISGTASTWSGGSCLDLTTNDVDNNTPPAIHVNHCNSRLVEAGSAAGHYARPRRTGWKHLWVSVGR